MFFKYNNNDKVFYEKYGQSNNTIIILPGWGNNRRTFNDMINNLKNDYTVYIFDYPGFGNSPLPSNDLSIYDYSNIINSFIKYNKIKEPIVIGHSFGGRVIITLSGFEKVQFKKIILISSAGIVHKKNKKQLFKQTIYKILKYLGKILPKSLRTKYLNKLISIFGSNDFKNLDERLRKTFINIVKEDLKEYLKDIKTETLLIWGENDTSTPIKDAYIMKENIKNSKLVAIENSNHFCYLEKNVLVNDIILDFIKKD